MNRILSNQNVLKLVYYTSRDWQSKPELTREQVLEMFDSNQISCVPKIRIDADDKTYLRLVYGTTTRNATNPEFRDNTFNIDIICHYKHWDLGDFQLRPYSIAGEIDTMLDKQRLTGIGKLEFLSCSPVIYNEEFAGVSLSYLAIRGSEDALE